MAEEEREGDEENREEMQQWRSSQVGGNNLINCYCCVSAAAEDMAEVLLSVACSDRLQNAALGQLDGLYQTMRRGDPGALDDREEKS